MSTVSPDVPKGLSGVANRSIFAGRSTDYMTGLHEQLTGYTNGTECPSASALATTAFADWILDDLVIVCIIWTLECIIHYTNSAKLFLPVTSNK